VPFSRINSQGPTASEATGSAAIKQTLLSFNTGFVKNLFEGTLNTGNLDDWIMFYIEAVHAKY